MSILVAVDSVLVEIKCFNFVTLYHEIMWLKSHVTKKSCDFTGRISLKKLQSYEKIFLCQPQKRRTRNQHFKVLFFTINLDFVTSNQISICKKLNLSLTSKIYLVVLALEMQKRIKQIKVFFYFVWKETNYKPLKLTAAKAFFFSLYAIGTTSFDKCFLFHVITGRHYILKKFIATLITTLIDFYNRYVIAFFEINVLK